MRKSAFPGTTYLTAVQFSPNRSLDRTIELISDWAIDRLPSITRILIYLSSAEAQLRTFRALKRNYVPFSPSLRLDRTIELISDWAIDRIPSITRILIYLSQSAQAQLRTFRALKRNYVL